ncbi:methyltransferase domain-containing protein [Candidatus Peregrinibacteria bacterium]|nr:MAG: methyltransferase domain-containing protein [Candidatus Peregrinibacteria bacterium]
MKRGISDTSHWGKDDAQHYEVAKHGPDGRVFLDPYLYQMLLPEHLAGATVADLGCGTGPWSQHVIKQGASEVIGVDLNQAMLDQAREKMIPNATFGQQDVAKLNLDDDKFDRILSINVGCNLPSESFEKHFEEAHRIAKPGGRMIVTAPDSLLVPFTDGEQTEDIQEELNRLLAEKNGDVKAAIGALRHVLRATFVVDENGKNPTLVTDENKHLVKPGKPMIRRIPGLVVPNNFHTANEYISAAAFAGWEVRQLVQAAFRCEKERVACEEKLGTEYMDNSPFLIMELEK